MLVVSALPHHHHSNGMVHFETGRHHNHDCGQPSQKQNNHHDSGDESNGCVVYSIFATDRPGQGISNRMIVPDHVINYLFLAVLQACNTIYAEDVPQKLNYGAFLVFYNAPETVQSCGLRAPPAIIS